MKLLGRMTCYPGIRLEEFLTSRVTKGEKRDKAIVKQKAKDEAKRAKEAKKTLGKIYAQEVPLAPPEDEELAEEESKDLEQGEAKKETTVDDPELKSMRLYIDLREGSNAFSWVLSRR